MAKEKAVETSRTKSTITLSVPAYSDGKLVGHASVVVFQENEVGLAEAKKSLSLVDLANVNRQRVTDAKNNLRRGTSAIAALRAVAKANPAVEAAVKSLLKRAEEGTLTAEYLESIGA